MVEKVSIVKTPEQKVEDLISSARKELTNETTNKIVSRIKIKLQQRQSTVKILANIDREIDEMKLELRQELELINE